MKKIFLTIIVALIVGISVGSFAQADTPKQSWWQFFKMLKRAPEKQLVPVQPQRPATEPGRESVKETPDNKPGPAGKWSGKRPMPRPALSGSDGPNTVPTWNWPVRKTRIRTVNTSISIFTENGVTSARRWRKRPLTIRTSLPTWTKNFLLYQVNGDEAADLTRKYVIRGYPTGLFMDPAGNVIASLPGFWPPDKFLDVLKFIKSESYKQMSYEEYASKRHN